jgi:hypothetical protein
MILCCMLYHITLGGENCLAVVASVLGTMYVHHVVYMRVFVISHKITVITFNYFFIKSFLFLYVLSELFV